MDGSWRVVEGEHESFDTNYLADDDDEHVLVALSSGSFSTSFPTQSYSQSQSRSQAPSFAMSQDSIRDFANHYDDDHVILREPFRPTIKSSLPSQTSLRSPEPQFRMPLVDVESGRRGSGASSNASIRTVRPLPPVRPAQQESAHDDGRLRRRQKPAEQNSPSEKHERPRRPDSHDDQGAHSQGIHSRGAHSHDAHGERLRLLPLFASLSTTLLKLVAYVGDVFLIALNYAKYPIGALLALYLCFVGILFVQNTATRSLAAVVSPICHLPGASLLDLPFCAARPMPEKVEPPVVQFDDLMGVQAKFEQVLEKSAHGVSLPFEMKRSEVAVRDLRSLVRHSDLQVRHELVVEFDGYVDAARRAAGDLQRFNTHVGSAVDSIISINRWTSRYIDSLAPAYDDFDRPSSLLWSCISWLAGPLLPFLDARGPSFSETAILDQYVEHTSRVSDRISGLIIEAQALLRLLSQAEEHLFLIYDISSRSSNAIASRRDDMLRSLWSRVGGNSGRLHNFAQQLHLLGQVESQRSSAVAQLAALILELEAIQANLGDLRDRVADPEIAAASALHHASPRIPLSVHVDTIDRGIERLQAARARIRAAEDDRVRLAVASAHDATATPTVHHIEARNR